MERSRKRPEPVATVVLMRAVGMRNGYPADGFVPHTQLNWQPQDGKKKRKEQ